MRNNFKKQIFTGWPAGGGIITVLFVFFLLSGCEKDDLVAIRSIDTIEPVITGTTVVTGGIMTANKEIELVEYGIAYNTAANPVTEDNISPGTDLSVFEDPSRYTVEFKSQITLLSPGTKYYIRAFVTTRTGTAYGNQISFTIN